MSDFMAAFWACACLLGLVTWFCVLFHLGGFRRCVKRFFSGKGPVCVGALGELVVEMGGTLMVFDVGKLTAGECCFLLDLLREGRLWVRGEHLLKGSENV